MVVVVASLRPTAASALAGPGPGERCDSGRISEEEAPSALFRRPCCTSMQQCALLRSCAEVK